METEIIAMKICSKCNQEKPCSDFPTNGHYISGGIRLHSWCRECLKQHSALWQMANKEYFRIWGKEHQEETRLRSQAYRLAFPDKVKANKARSRERHRDESREYSRQYRLNHLDEIRECMAEYYPAYYLAHKDELLSYQRAYQKMPIGRALQRAAGLRRRARMMGVETKNLTTIIRAIHLSPLVACHICGQDLPGRDCHIDHIIPLSRGGSHTAGNIAPAHPACNRRKGTKILNEVYVKDDLKKHLI